MAARLNVEYERTENAITSKQRPNLTLVENVPGKTGIPCQKKKTRKKEMTYVITEEYQVTESEQDYAEQMLYEAILSCLKDNGALTAEETQACRERNQMRRKIKESKHEEL